MNPSSSSRQKLFLMALYLAGIIHWILFICLTVPPSGKERDLPGMLRSPASMVKIPSFSFDRGWFIDDNWLIYEKVLTVLKEGIRTGTVPYHVPGFANYGVMSPSTDSPVGDRLFALPDGWPVSPQILLLPVLSLPAFIILNWLFLYTLGFIGCLLIRRRYQLGTIPFTFLFLLFNCNGFATAHMTIRAPDDLGYFLTPFLILLILRASEIDLKEITAQRRVGLWMGLVLAAIWYQGAAHPFIEWVTFLLFWGLFSWRYWRVALYGFASAFSLCAVRLLPAVLNWGLTPRPHVRIAGTFGYGSLDRYVDALVVAHPYVGGDSWGLFDAYVSLWGLFALIYLVLWGPFKGSSWVRFRSARSLWVPTALVLLLTFRGLKRFILPDVLPLFNAETTTSRYMLIPLTLAIVVAAINLQGAVEKYGQSKKLRGLMLGGLGITALLLLNHSLMWRLWIAATKSVPWTNQFPVPQIRNDFSDALYVGSVRVGLAISLISFVMVVGLLVKLRGRQPVSLVLPTSGKELAQA